MRCNMVLHRYQSIQGQSLLFTLSRYKVENMFTAGGWHVCVFFFFYISMLSSFYFSPNRHKHKRH